MCGVHVYHLCLGQQLGVDKGMVDVDYCFSEALDEPHRVSVPMAIPFEGQEATKLFLKITWREWPMGVADEDLLLGYENTTTTPRRLDGG